MPKGWGTWLAQLLSIRLSVLAQACDLRAVRVSPESGSTLSVASA